MESNPSKLTVNLKMKQKVIDGITLPSQLNSLKNKHISVGGSSNTAHYESTSQGHINIISSEGEDTITDDEITEDEGELSDGKSQKQLVVYDPTAIGGGTIEPIRDPVGHQPQHLSRYSLARQKSRTLPSVGAFTVQCGECFKWRLIPTKEKYEEIREHILEVAFFCTSAQEWRPNISCDDPPDILQDGSRLWAIDKPNIARPPPGWQRLLRIRAEGSTKFADVYYVAPSGKRLRSMVEIQKFLEEHPEYIAQANLSRFSFQIPRPLQENYVRKRPPQMPGSLVPSEVSPIAWAIPEENIGMQFGGPVLSSPYKDAPILEENRTPKKKARKMPSRQTSNDVAILI